jgi:murein DD-endopeptidase MepM/ murein hydrolase activator NlpD
VAAQSRRLATKERDSAKRNIAGRLTLRTLAAVLILGLAVFAFGQGPIKSGQRSAGEVVLPMAPTGSEDAPLLDPNNTPRVKAPFRPVISNSDLKGATTLGVASALLKRPPRGSLMAPLEVLVRTSSFGSRRSPLTGLLGEFHYGQDFAAPCGTRVYAADTGVVRAAGWHPWGGGNRLEIDHGNGLITTYNHLLRLGAVKGSKIRVGEVVAKVGTTGSSTGCHLHFEVIENGQHKDPNRWKLLNIRQIDRLRGDENMISFDPSSVNTLVWTIPAMTGKPFSPEPPAPPPLTPNCSTRPLPSDCPPQDKCKFAPQASGCPPLTDRCKINPRPADCGQLPPNCNATPRPSDCPPPIDKCKTNPQAPGCPTTDKCETNPQAPGCPTADTCKTNPQAPGCPTTTDCAVKPDIPLADGCSFPANCAFQPNNPVPAGCPLPANCAYQPSQPVNAGCPLPARCVIQANTPVPNGCPLPADCAYQPGVLMTANCPLPAGCVIQANGTRPAHCPIPANCGAYQPNQPVTAGCPIPPACLTQANTPVPDGCPLPADCAFQAGVAMPRGCPLPAGCGVQEHLPAWCPLPPQCQVPPEQLPSWCLPPAGSPEGLEAVNSRSGRESPVTRELARIT